MKKHFLVTNVEVKDGRGCRRASGRILKYGTDHTVTAVITLPRWSRSKLIALHEVAHGVTRCWDSTYAWHGPEFCGAYLKIVRHYLGHDVFKRLRDAFDLNGVLYVE